jgi:predicted nuclease of predicted toxin-antitoxin system
MKLLLDENLSRRLVPLLADSYPGTTHVVLVGLERATDLVVWEFAAANGCVIVTKDDDFSALAALRGHPPRVLKLTLGNSSSAQVLSTLLTHQTQIEDRFADASVALVELASMTTTPGR